MQRPYTIRDFAERAGSGNHTPPPPEIPRCARCGAAIRPGQVYCERAVCRRRWVSTGNTRRKAGEDEPTPGSYS